MNIFGLFSSGVTAALGLSIIIGFFLFESMIGLYALVSNLYPASIGSTLFVVFAFPPDYLDVYGEYHREQGGLSFVMLKVT